MRSRSGSSAPGARAPAGDDFGRQHVVVRRAALRAVAGCGDTLSLAFGRNHLRPPPMSTVRPVRSTVVEELVDDAGAVAAARRVHCDRGGRRVEDVGGGHDAERLALQVRADIPQDIRRADCRTRRAVSSGNTPSWLLFALVAGRVVQHAGRRVGDDRIQRRGHDHAGDGERVHREPAAAPCPARNPWP